MAIDFWDARVSSNIAGSSGDSYSWREFDTPISWLFHTLILVIAVWILVAAVAFKYSQAFRDFLKKRFDFAPEFLTNYVQSNQTKTVNKPQAVNLSKVESEKKTTTATTTVSINSEKMSMGIFLFCLFLPIFAPIIALFQLRILLFIIIVIVWMITFPFLFIPFIGIVIGIIVDLIIAIQVAKSNRTTEVVVNH